MLASANERALGLGHAASQDHGDELAVDRRASLRRASSGVAGNGLRSCLVLSGDAHTAFVCDLKRDFDDEQAAVIAAEFCGTSITSPGRAQTRTDAIVRDNRHILYGDSAHRGYMVLDVTAEQCTARLRVIDNPADRQSAVATAATFVVDAGRPGTHPA